MKELIHLSIVVFTSQTLEISFYPSSVILEFCWGASSTVYLMVISGSCYVGQFDVGSRSKPRTISVRLRSSASEHVSHIGWWGFPIYFETPTFPKKLNVDDKVCWLKFDGSRRRVQFCGIRGYHLRIPFFKNGFWMFFDRILTLMILSLYIQWYL